MCSAYLRLIRYNNNNYGREEQMMVVYKRFKMGKPLHHRSAETTRRISAAGAAFTAQIRQRYMPEDEFAGTRNDGMHRIVLVRKVHFEILLLLFPFFIRLANTLQLNC